MLNEDIWKRVILAPDTLVRDAISILSDTGLRIVLIVDSNLSLLGTVTDGDIRRGLMKGLSLDSSIEEIVNRDPVRVDKRYSRVKVLEIMSAKGIFQIPVVNKDSKLIGLHLWDEITSPIVRRNVVVIMAGGKGTRLLPRTEKTPKPMLSIAGKPILEHIINQAKKDGFTNFVLAIHHLGQVIEAYFGDGTSLGVKIDYIREDSPMGTAGALRLLNPKPEEAFIVSNGDVLTDVRFGDILDFHLHSEAEATMAVQVQESQSAFGVVKTQGIHVIGYEEKPIQRSLVNAGVYVLNPTTLELVEDLNFCDMPTLLDKITMKGSSIVAFPIHESWRDLGTLQDFSQAETDLNSINEKNRNYEKN